MRKPVIMGFVGNTPFYIVILKFHPMPFQGCCHPLKFLDALIIIVNKNSRNMSVPRLNQEPKQTVSALFIVNGHFGIVQFFIIIIVKDNRYTLLINLRIAIQIGVHQACLYAIHDKPLKILMDYRLKAAPLIGKLIIC